MLIRADVKCYYCGFVSGQVEGDPQRTPRLWNFRSRSGVSPPPSSNRQLRCCRCGGPVFLDEIETVRRTYRGAEPVLVGAHR